MSGVPLPAALSLALVVMNGFAAGATDGVRPHHETTLTENETAALWSTDPDDGVPADATPYEAIASVVDITYRDPPDTAERWSSAAFEHFDGTDPSTSIVPEHATTESKRYIADAHVTMYGLHPSTRLHGGGAEESLLVGETGTVRAFVDYRVDIPDRSTRENTTRTWTLVDHHIVGTTLRDGDRSLDDEGETHTPQFEYADLSGHPEFTLSTTIEVTVRVTERTRHRTCEPEANESNPRPPAGPGQEVPFAPTTEPGSKREPSRPLTTCRVITEEFTRTETERITVRETTSAAVDEPSYDLTVARFPDGTERVHVRFDTSWRALDSERGAIRSRWRFYTARDRRWDRLDRRTEHGDTTIESALSPVFVHAFPSTISAESSDRSKIDLLGIEGFHEDPPGDFHANVRVDYARAPYELADQISLRTPADTEFTVRGLVRGTTERLSRPSGDSIPEIRRTTTDAEVVNEPRGGATIRVSVRDARTGESIAERLPVDELGHIEVDGHRVPLDSTGSGRIWVREPGAYTATYHPPTDRRVQPFVGSTDTVRWHPLADPAGTDEIGKTLAPFVVPATIALLIKRWARPPSNAGRRRK